jgi:hypothetical protein
VQSTRRIWCELYDHRELARPKVLTLLATRGIELLFAVTPPQLRGVADVVRACRDSGVRCGIWPLLDARDGRWVNEITAARISAFGIRLLDSLADANALPDELAVDLEPPFETLARPGLRTAARLLTRPRPVDGLAMLSTMIDHARARGLRVTLAAMPMAIAEGGAGWQALMATPVDRLDGDHISAMIYTSLVEGYARGALDRRDATAILARYAEKARSRPRVGVSLGAVGRGSLGDEPTYRDVSELAEDVAIARAAGVDDLGLFSLCGVLARPRAEAWLDAFVHTPPADVLPRTRRAGWVLALLQGAGLAFGLIPR